MPLNGTHLVSICVVLSAYLMHCPFLFYSLLVHYDGLSHSIIADVPCIKRSYQITYDHNFNIIRRDSSPAQLGKKK